MAQLTAYEMLLNEMAGKKTTDLLVPHTSNDAYEFYTCKRCNKPLFAREHMTVHLRRCVVERLADSFERERTPDEHGLR